MGEVIIDGRGNYSGNNFILGITQNNHALVAGSIYSLPGFLGSTVISGIVPVSGTAFNTVWIGVGSIIASGTTIVSGGTVGISGIVNQGNAPWMVSGIIEMILGSPQNSYNPVTILQYVIVNNGSVIGSIFKNTLTGSVLRVLAYDSNANLTTIGSWVVAPPS